MPGFMARKNGGRRSKCALMRSAAKEAAARRPSAERKGSFVAGVNGTVETVPLRKLLNKTVRVRELLNETVPLRELWVLSVPDPWLVAHSSLPFWLEWGKKLLATDLHGFARIKAEQKTSAAKANSFLVRECRPGRPAPPHLAYCSDLVAHSSRLFAWWGKNLLATDQHGLHGSRRSRKPQRL